MRILVLRPSGAATWVVCAGYIALRAMYPELPDEADNEIREDGTACHWVASQVWTGVHPKVNSLSSNNRVITQDMYDAVDLYHDVLRSWPNVRATCEMPIRIDRIYPGMVGTPDAFAYDPESRTLRIADLKYGFGFVEVWENWQMICYAVGLLDLLDLDDLHTWVEFTIVQPRSTHPDGHVRTWRVRASDLRAQTNVLHHAAHVAMTQENAPCVVNPGCTDCPARHVCVTLQQAALTGVYQSYGSTPHEMSAVAIGKELDLYYAATKYMEARVTGLTAQLEGMIRGGTVVPGWGMEPTYARERWRDGADLQIVALQQYFPGTTLTEPPKPISPAQARHQIPASLVAVFSHKPSTGVRLKKSDPLQARKKFQQST